jgi:hypothetical protein
MSEHKQSLVRMIRAVSDAINFTVGGTLLGGTGGALFGTVWVALTGLMYGEMWRFLSAGAYIVLCGATAGGLLGAYRSIFDRQADCNPDSAGCNTGNSIFSPGRIRKCLLSKDIGTRSAAVREVP